MKYLFTVPIEKASGYVLFTVEAENEGRAEALVRENNGLHPAVYHEVQILAVGEPKCLGLASKIRGEKGC